MLTREQSARYEDVGYLVTDDAVDAAMLSELLDASRRAVEKVRSGAVDVFTHWATEHNTEPWAIRGLLAPEFGEPVFAEYLLSKPIMSYVHDFLGPELRLGSVLIFTNPYHEDWGFGWHRDFGKNERNGTEEVELEILNRPRKGIKWHLALVDDTCLHIVPTSQRRYRTEHERRCLLETRHEDIPGQVAVELKAGQTAFWNGNAIHRGVMKKDVERLTVAGSWNQHTIGDEPQETDSRFKWRLADTVRTHLPEAMLPYYDRWRELQLG